MSAVIFQTERKRASEVVQPRGLGTERAGPAGSPECAKQSTWKSNVLGDSQTAGMGTQHRSPCRPLEGASSE